MFNLIDIYLSLIYWISNLLTRLLSLPTRLLNSKMQTMMTCESKYYHQCFRAEIKESTSLSLCVRVQLEPCTLLGINVEHWLQVNLVWKEVMKTWKLDLNNHECLIPKRVDFHSMLGNHRWLDDRKDFWYGPPVQVPPRSHLFGRYWTLLCSMNRRRREW